MLQTFFQHPLIFLVWAVSLVIAITIHEFSHGLVADHLGDPTARLHNRLSLNPLKHLDPLGTIALLLTGFGWGKPVPFDPYNLQNPRKDSAIIALAGPTSNVLFAMILSIILHLTGTSSLMLAFFAPVISLNIALAVFNLIPIHPLDGGKIIIGFLPKDMAYEWQKILDQYGILILIFLLFPFGNSASPISYLISPIINGILQILL